MLKQQVEQGIKEALKAGEQLKLSTLRMLLAAIQNEEISKQRQLTNDDIIMVVQKQVKQHRESIEAFEKGGRIDLVSKEKDEMSILSKFLPQQLSPDELRKIVEEVIAQLPESERRNIGRVVGQVMGRVKGKADGNTVSKAVKEVLSKNVDVLYQ